MTHNPHIGIVGCSAEGAALCYRTLCLEGASFFGRHGHPEVSMHTYCLSDYMKLIEKDDWVGVGNLMLSSAQKLQSIGAQVLVCPDNTIHQAFSYVEKRSPCPWLHIAHVVLAEAKNRGIKCLGVLGTKYLMEGPVYKEAAQKLEITVKVPPLDSRLKINQIIFDELVNGIIRKESEDFFYHSIHKLKEAGCDGVVLGCTEIPLIVNPIKSPLPTFDSTRLLARAALDWASKEKQ